MRDIGDLVVRADWWNRPEEKGYRRFHRGGKQLKGTRRGEKVGAKERFGGDPFNPRVFPRRGWLIVFSLSTRPWGKPIDQTDHAGLRRANHKKVEGGKGSLVIPDRTETETCSVSLQIRRQIRKKEERRGGPFGENQGLSEEGNLPVGREPEGTEGLKKIGSFRILNLD